MAMEMVLRAPIACAQGGRRLPPAPRDGGGGMIAPVLIVGVSANGDNPFVRRDCLAAGMDAVLAKPLDMAAFVSVSPPRVITLRMPSSNDVA